MNIALVTGHTENYSELAALTLPGKQEYALQHGYKLFVQTDGWMVYPDRAIGFDKCFYIEKLMLENPDVEWFWWSGTDCLITNHNTKLENIIDDNFHFIVCKDDSGINADVFFIRNTEQGLAYIRNLQQPHSLGTEQANMWDDEKNPKWQPICKYIPQNVMNSYNLNYYRHKGPRDVFGQRNNWEKGDFVIQAVTGWNPGFDNAANYAWKIKQIKEIIDTQGVVKFNV